MSPRFLVTLLLVISVLFACEDDQVDQTAELVGRWEVIQAFRDQVPTESLTGLYYDFSAAGKLRTNMTGTEESYVYTLEDRQLAQREGGLDADYEVEKLSTDTLILRTELRRKKFRIILQRTNSAAPDSIVPATETE